MHLLAAYESMGGEVVMHRLVERFYDLTDEDLDYFGIRKLYPQDLNRFRRPIHVFVWVDRWPVFIC